MCWKGPEQFMFLILPMRGSPVTFIPVKCFLTFFSRLFLTFRLRWNFTTFLGNVVVCLTLPIALKLPFLYFMPMPSCSIHGGTSLLCSCCLYLKAITTTAPTPNFSYLTSVLSTFSISHIFKTSHCCYGLSSVNLCITWKARAGSVFQPKFLPALTIRGLPVL